MSSTTLFEKDANFLVAPTGAGKTVCALTAFSALKLEGECRRLLVIASLKIAESAWSNEAPKWEHLHHLRVNLAIGKPDDRLAAISDKTADVVIINPENVPWLFKAFGHNHHFDALIVDESSQWRMTGGAQFKAIRAYIKGFKWRCCMTATPVAEDWTGLFGQMMLADNGERLGRNKDKYLRSFFYPTDYEQRNWAILPGKEAELASLIADIVHIMPDYKGNLPPMTITRVPVKLPDNVMEIYAELQRDLAVDVGGVSVEAMNMAVLTGKLQQVANGFLYDEEKQIADLHSVKMNYLESHVINRVKVRGESVVIAYWYQADLEKLKKAFPGALRIGSKMKTGELAEVLEAWQLGEEKVLLLHPASAGHGVDGLQLGGHHLIWYAPPWSRDKFEQTIGRLWRRGQVSDVEVQVLMATGTIDEVIMDSVEGKGEYHELFLEHLG